MIRLIKLPILILGKIYYNLAFKLKLQKPTIIISIDGGICSQMHQYLLGVIFTKKNIDVEYDLNFFKVHGMDVNHKQVRNFDLLKAFPDLKFKSATKLKTKIFEYAYKNVGKYPDDLSLEWVNITPPKILKGYYADPTYIYTHYFKETFQINPEKILDDKNKKIFNTISNISDSVAIHVRRGDLSNYQPGYGYPVTIEYFDRAISFLYKELSNPYFFFFSDDAEYVKTELIPNINNKISYTIIQNGADKGYMDLVLISNCKHQITSKGTLGKFAALLNENTQKIVITSRDDKQTFMLNNIIGRIIQL